MVATAIIGGVTSIAGAAIQGSAAKSAAKAQQNAAAQSNALLQKQYDQTRADLSPYNQGGQADFARYNSLMGTGPGGMGAQMSTLSSLPGYQFTLGQGLKATQNSAAARGLGLSGAAQKGAASYATGLANSTYGTYANQLLAGAGLGENAAAGTASANNDIAGAQAGNIVGAGKAQSAGIIGQANALQSGVNGLGGAVTQGIQATNGVSNGLNSLFLFNALNKGQGNGLYGGPSAFTTTYNGNNSLLGYG